MDFPADGNGKPGDRGGIRLGNRLQNGRIFYAFEARGTITIQFVYYISVSTLDYFCWYCYVLNENSPRNSFQGEHQYGELKEDNMYFIYLWQYKLLCLWICI